MQEPGINWRRARTIFVVLTVAGLAFLFWKRSPAPNPTKPLASTAPVDSSSPQPESIRLTLAQRRLKSTPTDGAPVNEPSAKVAPQPMKLNKRILSAKKWNDGPDAFGLDKPAGEEEGATVGPSSVAYVQGKLHLLDNVNKRIMVHDKNGNLISSIPLPTKTCTDIAVDSSGTQLLVIDHYQDKVYRVEGNEAVLIASVSMKDDYPIGTKFEFDAASNSLRPQEVHQDGLADIDGNNLIVSVSGDQKISIPFDRPVACVEEVVKDAKGVVWVLYTLEGDYRMRRIARLDHAQGTVGTAEVDVWFAFDSTRHMAATENGVVLFAGDDQEGRLVSFEYGGTDL